METILLLGLLGDPDLNPGSQFAGGLNKTIKELIDFFKDKEYSIFLISTVIANKDVEYKLGMVHIYKICISEEDFQNQDFLYDKKDFFIKKIKQLINENKYYIKLIHSLYWLSGLIAINLSKLYEVEFIHNIISCSYGKLQMSLSPKCKSQFTIERKVFKEAYYLLSITESEASMIEENYNVSKDKILIIGRPIHSAYSELYELKNEMNHSLNNNVVCNDYFWNVSGAYVYIGRITSEKGVLEIIKSWLLIFQNYNNKTPPLWIIGGSMDQIKKLRRDLCKKGIDIQQYEENHKIYWWGTLPQYSLASILQKAIVLIHHSKFEAGGRVILEAMARGIPVIGANNGFAKDLICSWKNGFIVEYGDIESLSLIMTYFIKNPFLSNMLGVKAHATIQSYLNSKNYFNTYKVCYTNLHEVKEINHTNYLYALEYGKINIFPYIDIKIADDEFMPYTINKLSIAKNCYLWSLIEQKTTYIVKQYYNKLNFFSYLYVNEDFAVSFANQFKATLESLLLNKIYIPSYINKENFLFVMEKLEIVELDLEFLLHSDVLKLFHKNKINKNSRYGIFSKFISELFKLNSMIKHNISDINTFLLKETQNQHEFKKGCNYGKELISHLTKDNNNLKLLPTQTCYFGDLGFDEAKTIILMQNNIFLEKDLTNIFIDNYQIYVWIGALLIEQIFLKISLSLDYSNDHLLFESYMNHYIFSIK